MMFDIDSDTVGMVGTTWFDEDGRMVIEFDGHEVARVNPVEAAGLLLLLKEALHKEGFDSALIKKTELGEMGLVQ